MPNESGKQNFPSAEELARRVAEGLNTSARFWVEDAQAWLHLYRAHAALMAERQKSESPRPTDMLLARTFDKTEERDFATAPKPEPEKVRCWMSKIGVITEDQSVAIEWQKHGALKSRGWFTPDTGDAG